MRRILAVVCAVSVMVGAGPRAHACDPYWEWCDWYDPYWDLPSAEVTWWWDEPAAAWTPTPTAYEAPQPAPIQISPDPAAMAADLGLHQVTTVYTGHVTETVGAVTTYSTETTALDAGTMARRIAVVGTGEASAYDLVVLGGRTAMSDGRVVAGEVYENYVWDGHAWVVNAYVFFQDDAEVARMISIPPAVTPTPAPSPVGGSPTIIATSAPAPATAPPSAAVAPAYVTPLTGDVPPPATPVPAPGTSDPLPRLVRAGIALAPQADPLGRVEVLRGRPVPLWPRATVDEVPARVMRWQLVAGELSALGPVAGTGQEPLVAMWETVTGSAAPFAVRIRVTVELPGAASQDVDATIEVIVRAPAIVQ